MSSRTDVAAPGRRSTRCPKAVRTPSGKMLRAAGKRTLNMATSRRRRPGAAPGNGQHPGFSPKGFRPTRTHPDFEEADGKRGRKKATPQGGFLALKKPDDVLLSRARCSLSSALRRFTVLFGMGRGGSTAPWSSDIAVRLPAPFTGTERPIRKEDIASIDHDRSCHPAGTGQRVVRRVHNHATFTELVRKIMRSSLTGN